MQKIKFSHQRKIQIIFIKKTKAKTKIKSIPVWDEVAVKDWSSFCGERSDDGGLDDDPFFFFDRNCLDADPGAVPIAERDCTSWGLGFGFVLGFYFSWVEDGIHFLFVSVHQSQAPNATLAQNESPTHKK